MQTINEFAATIKAKFPQYQSMDDTELVNKIVTKYPAYKSQVNPASIGVSTKTAPKSNSFDLKSLVPGLNETINTVGAATKGVMKAGQGVGQMATAGYNDVVNPQEAAKNPKMMQEGFQNVVGGALETAGAPLTGMINSQPEPIKGALQTTADLPNMAIGNTMKALIKQFRPDLDEAYIEQYVVKPVQEAVAVGGAAALVGGAMSPKAASEAPSIVNKAGAVMKKGAEAAYEQAIPPTPKEAALSQKFEAGTLEEAPRTQAQAGLQADVSALTKKGIGVKAESAASNLWKNTIEPAIKGSKVQVFMNDFLKYAKDELKQIPEKGRQAEMLEGLEALKKDYPAQADRVFNLETAQKIKSGLDEFTPQKLFNGKDVANGYTQVKNMFADWIRKKTYESLKDVDIKQKYLDWAHLKEISNTGIKARIQAGGLGGFGKFWSSLYQAGAVPLLTKGANMVWKLGDSMVEIKPNSPTSYVIRALPESEATASGVLSEEKTDNTTPQSPAVAKP